jgi:hypothetical protein
MIEHKFTGLGMEVTIRFDPSVYTPAEIDLRIRTLQWFLLAQHLIEELEQGGGEVDISEMIRGEKRVLQ